MTKLNHVYTGDLLLYLHRRRVNVYPPIRIHEIHAVVRMTDFIFELELWLQSLSTYQEMLFKSTHHGQSYMVPKYLCIRSKQIAEHLCLHMVRTKFLRTDPFESCHDKPNNLIVRSAKTQISIGISPVWSESSLYDDWVTEDPSFLHADSKDSDQTELMPRLIGVFSWRTVTFLVFLMSRLKSPTMWYVRPAKAQISLRIRAVWAEPLLVTWIFYEC